MPIFEYVCNDCNHKFEQLVMNGNAVKCKSCEGENLRKLFSVFASTSSEPSYGGFSEGAGCGRCGDPNGPCGS